MTKYIDVEKLKAELRRQKHELELSIQSQGDYGQSCQIVAYENILSLIDSLQEEQDRMRYCIEYINPKCPLLDNGSLNIRHLCIQYEHSAEMALTLMLSFGAKIYALYRGNVKDGKLGEWPTPMIVDADDWYSVDWMHDILDCGCSL